MSEREIGILITYGAIALIASVVTFLIKRGDRQSRSAQRENDASRPAR